jgi:hypothetical protein
VHHRHQAGVGPRVPVIRAPVTHSHRPQLRVRRGSGELSPSGAARRG